MASFSDFATHKLYCNATAYSHRAGVNVLLSISGETFRYGRAPKGKRAEDYVRECVGSVITDVTNEYRAYAPYGPDWDIVRWDVGTVRGEYKFSVWFPNTTLTNGDTEQ